MLTFYFHVRSTVGIWRQPGSFHFPHVALFPVGTVLAVVAATVLTVVIPRMYPFAASHDS